MLHIGIIGTGNMGSMLARKFIEARAVLPENIAAYNHTPKKLDELVKITGINAASSNADVVLKSDIIFICVRPDNIRNVFSEIRSSLNKDKTIVSVVSDISMRQIKEWSGQDAVRVIPSITSECKSGISVICFGDEVSSSVRNVIMRLFEAISRPFVTSEDHMSDLSDITSSSPAIIASVIREYARAAARRSGIPEGDAEFLLKETFIGTSKLFSDKGYSFQSLISEVSTKGGITAEGVWVTEKMAPALFDNVLLKMSEKHKYVNKNIE